eukprot:8854157-Prorocentrum_lima.AAC.1
MPVYELVPTSVVALDVPQVQVVRVHPNEMAAQMRQASVCSVRVRPLIDVANKDVLQHCPST